MFKRISRWLEYRSIIWDYGMAYHHGWESQEEEFLTMVEKLKERGFI